MAGRKIAGILQMLIGLAGFAVTLIALIRVVLLWAREFQLPDEPWLYKAAMMGIVVFMIAWLWSLHTSLTLFRKR